MCKSQLEAIAMAREEPTGERPPLLSKQVQLLLDDLSPKELEWAARRNYQYCCDTKSQHDQQNDDRDPAGAVGSDTDARQRAMIAAAAAMVQRYLTSKSSSERALKSLRATLAFRAERNVDACRTTVGMDVALRRNLSNGNAYVTGRDRVGRATLVFTPRRVVDHEMSEEGLLWTMERAIACSRHKDDEINAIINFAGFDMWKHTPPMHVAKAILTLLRNYYVGHVHRILFVNAPASVNYVWNMFQPFAGQATKAKIFFVKSSDDLVELYHDDQLPPSILETGSHPEFHPDAYFAAGYDRLQCE
jgi:hypothetical protein